MNTAEQQAAYKVDFDQEYDDYGESIHVHFYNECPVCQYKRAGTSIFGAIYEEPLN